MSFITNNHGAPWTKFLWIILLTFIAFRFIEFPHGDVKKNEEEKALVQRPTEPILCSHSVEVFSNRSTILHDRNSMTMRGKLSDFSIGGNQINFNQAGLILSSLLNPNVCFDETTHLVSLLWKDDKQDRNNEQIYLQNFRKVQRGAVFQLGTLLRSIERHVHKFAGLIAFVKGNQQSLKLSTFLYLSSMFPHILAGSIGKITNSPKLSTTDTSLPPNCLQQNVQSSDSQSYYQSSQSLGDDHDDVIADIQVQSQEIAFDEAIEVSFTYSEASSQSWIGIFDAVSDTSIDSSVNLWVTMCGDQSTSSCPDQEGGTVVFDAIDPRVTYHKFFPLNPGEKKVCIMVPFYAPYGEVICQNFTIMDLPAHAVSNSTLTPTKSTFNFPEPVTADFIAALPIQNSWIGIHRSSDILEGMNAIPEPLLWVYSGCNNQEGDQVGSSNCASKITNGSVTIETEPLSSGSYILCMSFYRNQPYEKFICSSPIDIEELPCNTTGTSSFKVELKIDRPGETSWELFDVSSNEIIHSEGRSKYKDSSNAYNKKICVLSSSCYQFTIYDSSGDGLCCSGGNGYYKVSFDNTTVIEGGNFGSFDSSELFGEGCPTLSPSISSYPSQSMVPSSIPSSSFIPSSRPSISLSSFPTSSMRPSGKPSTSIKPSSEPTWSPTISNNPTTSPTEDISLIGIDEYGRRYFPSLHITTDRYYSYKQVPNCTSVNDNPGCVSIARSVFPDPPHWAGRIHATPPSCNKRKKQCDQGVPMSRRAHSSFRNPRPIHSVTGLNPVDLTGGDMATRSLSVADVNGDGANDIIVGNDLNQKNQLLLNNGNGRYSEAVDLPGGDMNTRSIVAVDVNEDGMVDILIGNRYQKNQLLLHDGDVGYSDALELPGDDTNTYFITHCKGKNGV